MKYKHYCNTSSHLKSFLSYFLVTKVLHTTIRFKKGSTNLTLCVMSGMLTTTTSSLGLGVQSPAPGRYWPIIGRC